MDHWCEVDMGAPVSPKVLGQCEPTACAPEPRPREALALLCPQGNSLQNLKLFTISSEGFLSRVSLYPS